MPGAGSRGPQGCVCACVRAVRLLNPCAVRVVCGCVRACVCVRVVTWSESFERGAGGGGVPNPMTALYTQYNSLVTRYNIISYLIAHTWPQRSLTPTYIFAQFIADAA